MAPRALMTELGLGASALGLGKYDPDQPRVPAGSGRESGRWTNGNIGAEREFGAANGQIDPGASPSAARPTVAQQSPKLVQVAADGPFSPAGINVVPVPPGDTLDPQGLNKPLSLAEQQAIADTFNTILTGQPQGVLSLNPHQYDNHPSVVTGAVLPPPIGKYTTYYIRSSARDESITRLVMDKGGQIYYTNNHYLSFYPVDLKINHE